jgi:GABA(A) receptor-associated protein
MFKNLYSLEKRSLESSRLLSKYPDRVPIVINVGKDVPKMDKYKFLVPVGSDGITVGQFSYVVRKRMVLGPEKALYIMCNNVLLPTSELISSVYEKYKSEDSFLYFYIDTDNTFGG